LSAAARAHAIPMMPAPTTARSKTPESVDWEYMESATQLLQHHDRFVVLLQPPTDDSAIQDKLDP
jgi:hypothetical protein